MARKFSRFKYWETMSRKNVRLLALAVFCLFATIGPLTLLMDSSILPGSWFRFFYVTILSGMFSASIILFMNKPLQLILAIVIFPAALFSTNKVENFFTVSDGKKIIVVADRYFKLTERELFLIETKRPMFGVSAIFLLATGYALFVRVIARENKRRAQLETEMSIAQNLQQSLLPASAFKTDGCEIAGVSVPATDVGGDYFDIIPLNEKEVVVVVADVSGHGVGAGILSAMTKSALYLELQHNSDPAVVLKNLNKAIYNVTDKKMFVSFAYLILDLSNRQARITTAGHLPLLRRTAASGALVEIRTANLALGMQPGTTYDEETIYFEKGDSLLMFTDGILEATNDKGEQFGMEKLRELLEDVSRPSAERLSASIVASVREFTVVCEFKDDATMVIVQL